MIVALAFIGFLVYRRGWRKGGRKAQAVRSEEAGAVARVFPFHQRLMAILTKCGYEAKPAQTAQEFAAMVGMHLRRSEKTANVANVPGLVADMYYRIRFGGQLLAESERGTLDQRLNELESAL